MDIIICRIFRVISLKSILEVIKVISADYVEIGFYLLMKDIDKIGVCLLLERAVLA